MSVCKLCREKGIDSDNCSFKGGGGEDLMAVSYQSAKV